MSIGRSPKSLHCRLPDPLEACIDERSSVGMVVGTLSASFHNK